MIDTSDNILLFIEPTKEKSAPVDDELTAIMEQAFEKAQEYGPYWRGFHMCACGKNSTNHNYKLENGMIVNSLCVHYMRFHRDEVPQSEIDKVISLKH